MKNCLIAICFLQIFISCRNEGRIETSSIVRKSFVDTLKKKVLAGDTNAYWQLSNIYYDSSPEEQMFWALLMANKFKFPQANLDVFFALKLPYSPYNSNDLSMMDSNARTMALYYLARAADQGVEEAKKIQLAYEE